MSVTPYRSLGGKHLYSCDGPGCGLTREPWGATWIYYGSIRDQEETPQSILTWCSAECANRYIDAHPGCEIPKPTAYDLKSELGRKLTRVWNAR